MSDKSSLSEAKVSSASTVLSEMQGIVRSAAEPGTAGESVKVAINRAARTLGLGYSRARSYWYGEVKAVPAHEADALREARLRILDQRIAHTERELLRLQLARENDAERTRRLSRAPAADHGPYA